MSFATLFQPVLASSRSLPVLGSTRRVPPQAVQVTGSEATEPQAYRLGFSPLRRASHDLCIMAQCSHVAYARRRNPRSRQ